MARELEQFSPRRRSTIYPYDQWFCGKILQLELGHDFTQSPQAVATSIRSHAKRSGFPAAVRPVRDFRVHGNPYRFVEVWGDPARSLADGLPADIKSQLSR